MPCLTANSFSELPFRAVNLTEWLGAPSAGAWPDWFAAVGTVAAFMVALVVYVRSQQDAKKSQARLVHAYVASVRSVSDGARPGFRTDEAVFVGEDDHFEYASNDDGSLEAYALRSLLVVDVKVENNSDEIVTKVVSRLFVTNGEGHELDLELIDVPILVPRSSILRYAIFSYGDLGHGGKVAATSFTDSSGRRWYRHERSPLHRRRWWNRHN